MNVIRIDKLDARNLDVVQKDQRGVPSIDGADLTTDLDERIRTDLSGRNHDVHSRNSALKSTTDIGDRTAFQCLTDIHRGDSAGDVRPFLGAVADHHNLGEHLVVFFHHDCHPVPGSDNDILITKTRYLERRAIRHVD